MVIRAYNLRAAYLKETFRSVLAQDPDPDEMQIEAMNDVVRLLFPLRQCHPKQFAYDIEN